MLVTKVLYDKLSQMQLPTYIYMGILATHNIIFPPIHVMK